MEKMVGVIWEFLKNEFGMATVAREKYDTLALQYEESEKKLRKEKNKGQFQGPELLECERARDVNKMNFSQSEEITFQVFEKCNYKAKKLLLLITSNFLEILYDYHVSSANSIKSLVKIFFLFLFIYLFFYFYFFIYFFIFIFLFFLFFYYLFIFLFYFIF